MKPPTFEEVLKRARIGDGLMPCPSKEVAGLWKVAHPLGGEPVCDCCSEQEAELIVRLLAFAHAGGYTALYDAKTALVNEGYDPEWVRRLLAILDGAAVPAAGREPKP